MADQIRSDGGTALATAVHMGDINSIDRLIESTLEAYGGVDILVNNAGINVAMGGLSELSPSQYDKMYEVNQRGPWYLASRLAPNMAEHGGGCVINVLSVAFLPVV